MGERPLKRVPKPQAYRLRDDIPTLALKAGATVYRHPNAPACPSDKFPASLEPRRDACWFPVAEDRVEPQTA